MCTSLRFTGNRLALELSWSKVRRKTIRGLVQEKLIPSMASSLCQALLEQFDMASRTDTEVKHGTIAGGTTLDDTSQRLSSSS